jgi:hypothetical protein
MHRRGRQRGLLPTNMCVRTHAQHPRVLIPMKGDDPITVPPLIATGPRGPLLILGWMNNKHYTSTRPRNSRSELGDVSGSTNVETAQARATASQQDGPEDAVNGDSLPSNLQCMGGHESQQLEREKAKEANATTMAVQALGQGNGSDAGQGPAAGPDKAEGTASMTLGPADGPDRTTAPAAAAADATAQQEEARMAQTADQTPTAENVSKDVPAAVAAAAQRTRQEADEVRMAEQGSKEVPSAPSEFTCREAITIQDYKDWLRSHNLPDLLQQAGGWKDRRKRLQLGDFVFPDRETYRSITTRTQLLQHRQASICIETPY